MMGCVKDRQERFHIRKAKGPQIPENERKKSKALMMRGEDGKTDGSQGVCEQAAGQTQ